VHELATLITDIVMMELNIEGKTLIFARRMAITNGEYLVFAPDEFRRSGSVYGTIKPRMKRPTT
jgi:hypothetical protein